jgi:Glycosyl hydrolases family 28/Bacterial Ig-like domain (group 2)
MRFKVLRAKRSKTRAVLRRAAGCEALETRCLLSVTLPANIPTTVFNVTTFGAVANGMGSSGAANATAIQNAINAAKVNVVGGFTGGIVEIPAAALPYESGPITLASNVDLQVDSGAELQTEPMANYPGEGGASVSNFINGSNLTNFEITGSGDIDGNGQAWWTAYTANNAIGRPRLINITGSNLLLVQNIELSNSPMFHLAISTTNNVTINAITISAPGTNAPNTDGMDLGGSHYMVENCNVSTGDDNVVMKPGSTFTSDVTVTGCTFGFGHGMSIGGQTNLGLNGLTITNDTFNGTTAGIRLKASRIAGGLVTNITISNITMTNVQFPINFDSYYLDGTIPTTSPQDPPQAITTTTPFWQNIAISNLTATWNSSLPSYSASAFSDSYCGVIWGLPEAPIENVTLTNVKITSGRFGMDLDHVRNIFFDSSTVMTPGSGSAFISNSSVSTPYDAIYWLNQNIGSPATAGSSSLNPTTNTYTVTGSGADIGVVSGSTSSDQFDFDNTPMTGDATFIAQVTSQTSTDPSAKAGIMIRSSTASNSVFAAVIANPNGNVQFLWRSSTGALLGSASIATTSTSPWVKLVRSGNTFTAFAGTSSTNFTQIGTAQTVTMSSSVLAGLAVTSHNNAPSVANTAVFNNVELFCAFSGILDTATPVTTATTVLGVLAADVFSDAGITYTWSTTTFPTGALPPVFSVNDSNPAVATTVNFYKAGSYGFLLTVRAASGLVSTFSLPILNVIQTLTTVAVNPANVLMHESATQQLTATTLDQFNNAMATQPTSFTWTLVTGSVGSVSTSGLYTAPATSGAATIDATSNSIVGTSAITVSATATNLAPTVATAAFALPGIVIAKTANLSVLGADDNTEANLIYTWTASTIPTGAPAPTFTVNGTNVAKNTTVTVGLAGTYKFTATIKDASGSSTTSVATVIVNQTLTSITISPLTKSLNENGTQSFTATGVDQFSKTMSPEPAFFWSLNSGIGNVGASTGLYTAPAAAGSAVVQASALSVTSSPSTVTITNATPTVATPAAASPSPVPGTTTNLSVLGADDGGESNLIYTWAATIIPAGATTPNFSINGTNAAKNSVATFTSAGAYSFTVTIQDSGGLTTTSNVAVTVNQTVTSITVSPPSISVGSTGSLQFSAAAFDQFGNAIASPTFIWSTTGSSNSIDSNGLFQAGSTAGPFPVQAAIGSIDGAAVVTIIPTVFADAGTYYVALAADLSTEQIWVGSAGVGSPTYSVAIALLPSLAFSGGPDNLTVDFTNGDSVPAGGLSFTGGSGENSLSIIGTAGNDSVNVAAASVTFDSDSPVSYANVQSITVNGGNGADIFTQSAQPGGAATLNFLPTSADTLNINAGIYNIPAPSAGSGFNVYPMGSVTIANGASMAVQTAAATSDRTVMMLGDLAIGATGQFDLGGNDMIVANDTLADVNGMLAAGFTTGIGLASSLAASSGHVLGVELNNDSGQPLTSAFDGVSVGISDVLVKYTFFGDADLSGSVDANDYIQLDAGFDSQTGANPLGGWQNGDFNYDGKINGDDYTLIDNAFNTQATAPLAATANSPVISPPAAPQSQIVPAYTNVAVFSSSNEISLDQLSHRHTSRLADWLSANPTDYVPPT